MDQATYNTDYTQSLPPQIKNMMLLATPTLRAAQAVTLSGQGFLIDYEIQILLMDPFVEMGIRNSVGLTWFPSFLQPPLESFPNIPPLSGQIPYDPLNPPTGSLKVFWPNPPLPLNPAPPPTQPTGLSLGPSMAPDFPGYYEMIGDSPSIAVGTQTTIDGKVYTKTIVAHTPFAPNGNLCGWG